MTIDKAREPLKVQCDLGGGYNSNAVKLILAEIKRDHGQDAANTLILEFNIESIFGITPNSPLPGGW